MRILGKNVLLKPLAAPMITPGGIHLPQNVNDPEWRKNQQGIVLAVGSGIRESVEYRKGTHVFVEMYKPKTIQFQGEELLIVAQADIVGVMVNGGSFHPIGDKLLLRPIKTMHPSTMIERPGAYDRDEGETMFAQVELIGTGIRTKRAGILPFEVAIGDMVFLNAQAGRDVDLIEATYKLVSHKEIQGVMYGRN